MRKLGLADVAGTQFLGILHFSMRKTLQNPVDRRLGIVDNKAYKIGTFGIDSKSVDNNSS
jgi:hypothetical protein